jgi:protein-S-isoprenylcysteine O-methyltransferase Ste14
VTVPQESAQDGDADPGGTAEANPSAWVARAFLLLALVALVICGTFAVLGWAFLAVGCGVVALGWAAIALGLWRLGRAAATVPRRAPEPPAHAPGVHRRDVPR